MMRIILFAVLFSSCMPRESKSIYTTQKGYRQVKVSHISFFNGGMNGQRFQKGKAAWILTFNEHDSLQYIFANMRSKYPYNKVERIGDSMVLLTRTTEARYTMRDSLLFYKTYCVQKNVSYEYYAYGTGRYTDSANMVSYNSNFFAFNGLSQYLFDKHRGNSRFPVFHSLPITRLMQQAVAEFPTGRLSYFKPWTTKQYADEAAVLRAQMEFFGGQVR